ncbi:DUF2721 domain-containing protein [Sphingomicrobium astaxanthinifaciens]|uniref:DUF2721 domain-containing protein n=1 Tax=Sphingomicrobium astaxanthinifaciens TaxID=1227949 RepID=UPI001FCAF5DC|nr:DUF2721 domain-containing protein [Sphingomicrobium astaxanthinifaciens]MCJ7421197.1 DUF2721 domain-containing protein [Sphingomicrobium astaxanthinifaciens]
MIELLHSAGMADLIARTASTPKVQGILQLSLAPVFLLAGIGAFLNVMNIRLTWLVERINAIESALEDRPVPRLAEQLPLLLRRQRYAHHAVNLSTAAALMICLVVGLLFVSAFVRTPLGTLVALSWIGAMALIFTALTFFLRETSLATRNLADSRELSRRIARSEQAGEEPREA